MQNNGEFRMVFVSAPDEVAAKTIAKTVIKEKLGACAGIIPNTFSVFEWQGKIEERNEFLIIIKTMDRELPLLIPRIKELHSDEVPEIIAVDVCKGLPSYLDWIRETLI